MWDRDLLTAARGGYLNLAKTALEKGANINCYDSTYHQTPLITAIHNRRDEVAAFLIGKGADVSLVMPNGISAYRAAVMMEAQALAEVISDLINTVDMEDLKPVKYPGESKACTPKYIEAISFGPRLKILQYYPDGSNYLQENSLHYSLRFDGKPLGLIREISVLISCEPEHSHKRILRYNYHYPKPCSVTEEHEALLNEFRGYCREYGIELLETNLDTQVVREQRLPVTGAQGIITP